MSFASGKSRESSSGRERPGDARRVDGNAAGGMFSEVFVRDLTTARAKCAGCGAEGMIGALPVYAHGMGTVVRCPKCDRVILRVARTPQHIWLDATGATCIVISRGN
jgi:DNA-directed RNA polymerase subunit RPC12/RpoP